MTLSIGSTAPDFTADTTQGPIKFHDFVGDGYAILFSHPKDYTPVCTTELGYMAGLADEFAKRNTKVIGLSVDPVGAHEGWLQDIKDVTGQRGEFPDDRRPRPQGRQALQHAPGRRRRDVGRPDRREQCDGAHGLHRRARQADQGDAHLSDEHGPQLRRSASPARFDPADRQAFGGDAGQLEAGRGLHHRPVAHRTKPLARNSRTAGRR